MQTFTVKYPAENPVYFFDTPVYQNFYVTTKNGDKIAGATDQVAIEQLNQQMNETLGNFVQEFSNVTLYI